MVKLLLFVLLCHCLQHRVEAQTESLPVPIWAIGVVAGVVGLLLLVALIAGIFFCGWYAKKIHARQRGPTGRHKDPGLIGNEQVDTAGVQLGPVRSNKPDGTASKPTKTNTIHSLNELSRGNVCLKNQLGTCAYGTIWDAEVVLGPTFASRALVKVLDSHSSEDAQLDFMEEANHLKQVVHANVTRLFGVVSFNAPYYMVLELPANGDLKTFLFACRQPSHSVALTSRDILLPMIKDAASGLAYLHSLPTVHRDVAARNCAVTNDLGVKISVYGVGTNLFAEEYSMSESGELQPLRWMAPELLKNEDDGSSYTDVWAFGVLMWEIMSLGTLPYENVQDHDLQSALCQEEYRLPRPLSCKPDLYDLMNKCWKERPLKRPKMAAVIETIEKCLAT